MTVKTPKIADIAIIGGGIAGSAAAIMLGRKGYNVFLIDPHERFPDDFRCEKFNRDQIATLTRMGLADDVFSKCTPLKDVWVGRFGRLVNKMRYPHYGFTYQTVINAMRDGLPDTAKHICSKVKSVDNNTSTQKLTLADGSEIIARLVIVANGLNPTLRKQFEIEQEMLSKNHCMAIGFDLTPLKGSNFGFGSMTYWPEKASKKMSYFTVFKSGDKFRTNLFGYWEKKDAFLNDLQQKPQEALHTLMPNLKTIIGEFKVESRVHVRPIDIVQSHSKHLDGMVFVGDAFSTSCPGAGTGAGKALIDVERLCSAHIPNWFNGSDFSSSTLRSFYEDPLKLESDEYNFNSAWFLRSITMEDGLIWDARRWARFLYHFGKGKLSAMPFGKQKADANTFDKAA